MIEIKIATDGTVMLPRGGPLLTEIAKSLGDPKGIRFCEQAEMTKILFGKRMCG